MPRELWTTQQFAQQAGLSASTISTWLRNGKLKGEKQKGKWMISADQLAAVLRAPNTAPQYQPPQTTESRDTDIKAVSEAKSFTIEEFSAMTYLTVLGVEQWLKQGRLQGSQSANGQWRVGASNLDKPDVQRLVRK